MKINIYAMLVSVGLALTTCLASPCMNAIAQSSPVKVSIETQNKEQTFNLGEKIPLAITIENTGGVEAELSRSCDEFDNEVTLTDSNGDTPPLTSLGKKATSVFGLPCPRRALRLKPAAPKQTDLDISQFYDLTRPGEYTVSISRFVRRPRSIIKSNPIKIVIR